MTGRRLRSRWLGRVHYQDAHALQGALHAHATDDYLLLMEHAHVYTLGVRANLDHLLVPVESLGAEVVRTDRGGDVTYHGPGQLVGYPLVGVSLGPGAIPAHVHTVEQVVIDACTDLGLRDAGRLPGYPGVWVLPSSGAPPRKVCAVGVRVTRGRSMHGFALNVDPDLDWFGRIVPCGIPDLGVTSLAAEGVLVSMREAVEAISARAGEWWGGPDVERQDVAWTRPGAIQGPAGEVHGGETSDGLRLGARKPAWLRVPANTGPRYRDLKGLMRSLDLVTVCEEAGCPNIFECWNDGTATFMINGSRCTRACGFCQVDTSRPLASDPMEPFRVAEAVERLGLAHAVVTAVARDDLLDGGAAALATTVSAIRKRCPATTVELLIPDCHGDPDALGEIFDARPDVLNHNLETVARLQRVVRPSASYGRSLAVLARAAQAGLTAKSGLMVGLGETFEEVIGAMADLRSVGVSICTVGQYLRPSAAHLPVARWWLPEELDQLSTVGRSLGFAHVEASPLARSSYHARQAANAAVTAGAAASI